MFDWLKNLFIPAKVAHGKGVELSKDGNTLTIRNSPAGSDENVVVYDWSNGYWVLRCNQSTDEPNAQGNKPPSSGD